MHGCFRLLPLIVFVSGMSGQDVSAASLPTLTSAEQVRGLTPDQAALGYPVRIRGVVTDDVPAPDFFIQDSTAGIYVEGSHSPEFARITFPGFRSR